MKAVLIDSGNIVANVCVPGDAAWMAAMSAIYTVSLVADNVVVSPGDTHAAGVFTAPAVGQGINAQVVANTVLAMINPTTDLVALAPYVAVLVQLIAAQNWPQLKAYATALVAQGKATNTQMNFIKSVLLQQGVDFTKLS